MSHSATEQEGRVGREESRVEGAESEDWEEKGISRRERMKIATAYYHLGRG
jgi:hypothetical protein